MSRSGPDEAREGCYLLCLMGRIAIVPIRGWLFTMVAARDMIFSKVHLSKTHDRSECEMRKFVITAWFLIVSAGALAQAGPSSQPSEYTLGSGDELEVTVFGHADLSGRFVINELGQISLPLVGNVKVGGKSRREAEVMIRNVLRPDYLVNPRVSVQVMNYRPFYIIGEVNDPGSYPYVNGMTVTEAVALAGGYTYRAKKKEVVIIRASDESNKEIPATNNTPVMPGDVIKVPERFF